MNELKKQLEVDFLKTKTYEEINDMFNQLNDKLLLAQKTETEIWNAAIDAAAEGAKVEHKFLNEDTGEITKTISKSVECIPDHWAVSKESILNLKKS